MIAPNFPPPPPLRIDAILAATAEYFDLPAEAVARRRGHFETLRARMVAIHLCRLHTDASFAELARVFGDRDEADIREACDAAPDFIVRNRRARAALPILQRRLGVATAPSNFAS